MGRAVSLPLPPHFDEDCLRWRELTPGDLYSARQLYPEVQSTDFLRNDLLLYGGFVNHRYMIAMVYARHEPNGQYNQIDFVWVSSEWKNKGIELSLCQLIRHLDPTRPTCVSTKDKSFAKILTKGGFHQIDEAIYAIRAKIRDPDPPAGRRPATSPRAKKRPKNSDNHSS